MFATGVRQARFAWSVITGRRFHPSMLTALVEDLRATIEEFGSPGDDAAEMVSGATEQMRRELGERHAEHAVREAFTGTEHYRAYAGANLTDLEPTKKSTLKRNPAAFVWTHARPALLAQTTGTTGTPTGLWFSRYELEVLTAISAMGLMVHGGLRPEHVWVGCVRSRSLAQLIQQRAVGMTGAAYALWGVIDPDITVQRLRTPVGVAGKRSKPTHLVTTPSHLGALVQQAERSSASAADFGLTAIHLAGEIITDALAERARQVFGATIVDGYSATEIMPVAGTVCAQRHLHIAPDQGYVEVLRPGTGRPARPGEIGVITVTPFRHYRDTTRLLRFSTDDLVRVLPAEEQPECDLAAIPATSRILGRLPADGVIPDITTRDILDLLQYERALPLPTRYALDESGGQRMLYVVTERPDRKLTARLEQRITELGLPLDGLVPISSPSDLPAPCPVRSDLREDGYPTAAAIG